MLSAMFTRRALGIVSVFVLWIAPPLERTPSVRGQTVRAIVVGDISPAAHWGEYTANVVLDVLNVRGMLQDNLPKRQLDVSVLELNEDDQSDPQNLLAAIKGLSVAREDVVFFYYSGHGASDDRGHYLALAKGKLYRQDLLEALKSKGANLTVLLTDCCNLRSDGALPFAPGFEEQYPVAPSPLFKALFLESKGVVDVNGSAPGEGAFFTPLNIETNEMPGSIFTKALASWIEANRQQRRSWDELIRGVSLQVHTRFHDFYPKGVQVAKGEATQTQQNVYPLQYPGMPERKGPRTGLVVRDLQGKGVVILSVESGSPASQAFLIAKDVFISLAPQQVIVSVNGQPIQTTGQLRQALDASPQIVRMGIRDAGQGSFDVLLRMRY